VPHVRATQHHAHQNPTRYNHRSCRVNQQR
jgi:hypothetical protein